MNFSKAIKVAPIAVAFAVAACTGVRTQTTDVNPRMARASTCIDAVEVYESRNNAPYDYYELAWIEVEGNSVWTTDAALREQMRKKAADAGANGIIVNPVQESNATVKVLGEAIGARSATAKASGLAIYMPRDAGRVTLRCGR